MPLFGSGYAGLGSQISGLLIEGPDGWGAGNAGTISGSSQARGCLAQDGRSEGLALWACLRMQVSAKYQIEPSKARDALVPLRLIHGDSGRVCLALSSAFAPEHIGK